MAIRKHGLKHGLRWTGNMELC